MVSELLDFIFKHEDGFQRRLPSLYADFTRDRKLNPDNYIANSEEWRAALYNAARAGVLPAPPSATTTKDQKKRKLGEQGGRNLLSLHAGSSLLQVLDVDTWGRPAALGAVFQDAAEKKELMPVQEFLEAKESIYTKKWIPAVPSAWQVVSWGFRQIGLTGSNPSQLAEADFAVVQNIEVAATALQKKMEEVAYSPVTQCYSLETFRNTFAHSLDDKLPLSASDITLLLTYCSRDRPILQYDPASSTVKLSAQAPLDETDVSIAQVRTQEVALEKQMTILEEKVAADATAIRTAISRKDMNKARTLLRSKKLAEAALEQRRQNDIKLKEILFSIEKAQDSVAMMAIMTRSTDALRMLNKQIGGVERVDEIAEQLREEMEKGEDVQRALDQIGAESVAIDEDEVDEEFAALERQEREKEEAARRKIVEDKAREEAEQTARSMKELDELDLARRTAEDGGKKGEAQDINGAKDDVEDVLSQSIDRLDKLNLANGQADATGEKTTQQHAQEHERIPAS